METVKQIAGLITILLWLSPVCTADDKNTRHAIDTNQLTVVAGNNKFALELYGKLKTNRAICSCRHTAYRRLWL